MEQTEATRETTVKVQLTAEPDRAATLQVERRRHSQVQTASLVVLATGGVLTMMYLAKPVLMLTLGSVLIAFMLAPIVEICMRMHMPRSVGALIAVLLMCAVLYGVFYISFNQADEFVSELPKYSGQIRSVLSKVRQRAERVRQTTQNVLPEDKSEKNAVTVRQSSFDRFTSGAAGLTEFLSIAGFVPFLVFFMLSWQDHVRASTVMLFNMENRHTVYVTLGLIAQMIRGFIVGNVVIGIILGVVSTIAFWILGVPYFYVIGIISGIVSLMPYLGIVLAIVPPLLVSLGSMTLTKFLWLVSIVVFSHLIALNILYPKIIGSRLQLNPLAVTLSLLFWGWLWGAMGLILAVPLTAAIKIIFDHVEGLRAWGAWLGD